MTGKINEIKYGVFLAGQDYNADVKIIGVSSSLLMGEKPLLSKQNSFLNLTAKTLNAGDTIMHNIEAPSQQLQSESESALNNVNITPESSTNIPSVDTDVNEILTNPDNDTLTTTDSGQTSETQEPPENSSIDLENLKKAINDCYNNICRDLESLKQIKEKLSGINSTEVLSNAEVNNVGKSTGESESVKRNSVGSSTEVDSSNISVQDELKLEDPMMDPLLNDAMNKIQSMSTTAPLPKTETSTVNNAPASSQNENIADINIPTNSDTQNSSTSIPALETLTTVIPAVDEAPIQPAF